MGTSYCPMDSSPKETSESPPPPRRGVRVHKHIRDGADFIKEWFQRNWRHEDLLIRIGAPPPRPVGWRPAGSR